MIKIYGVHSIELLIFVKTSYPLLYIHIFFVFMEYISSGNTPGSSPRFKDVTQLNQILQKLKSSSNVNNILI